METPTKHVQKATKELLRNTLWMSSHDTGVIHVDAQLCWQTETGTRCKLIENGTRPPGAFETNGWQLKSCCVVADSRGAPSLEMIVWKVKDEIHGWAQTVHWRRHDSATDRDSLRLKRKLDMLTASLTPLLQDAPTPCTINHKCSANGCWASRMSKFTSIKSAADAACKSLGEMSTLAHAVHAQSEFYGACMENDAPRQEVRALLENGFSLPEGVGTGPLAVFVREGCAPLRAHAPTVAKLGGVLQRHLDTEFDAAASFPLDEAPWNSCELATIKVLLGYAYVGLSPKVRETLSQLALGEAVALITLLKFLDGGDTVPDTSKLHSLYLACRAHVQAEAALV